MGPAEGQFTRFRDMATSPDGTILMRSAVDGAAYRFDTPL